MLFEEFQDWYHGRHLGYWNWMIQQLWISISLRCLQSSFGSTWHFKNFKMAAPGHLGYRKLNDFNNFEFLCHCDASHQVSAQSDLGLRRRCRLKNFKLRPSWISERNDFNNFESLCHYDASHQVSAQSDLGFGRRCRLKNFKMAWRPSWISEWNDFSNFESLCHCDASYQVSAQSDLGFRRRCRLKNFKMAAILDIGTERF